MEYVWFYLDCPWQVCLQCCYITTKWAGLVYAHAMLDATLLVILIAYIKAVALSFIMKIKSYSERLYLTGFAWLWLAFPYSEDLPDSVRYMAGKTSCPGLSIFEFQNFPNHFRIHSWWLTKNLKFFISFTSLQSTPAYTHIYTYFICNEQFSLFLSIYFCLYNF